MKHGLLVFVGVSVEENIAIVAVAAPTIFVIGVVVVLLVIGMVAFEWVIRQSIQGFLIRVNW